MSYSEGPWSVEANAYGTIFVYGSKTYGTPSGFRYRELICGGDSYKTLTPDNAALIAAAHELLEVVKAFVAETIDYATLNKLGDAEQQHNVKWARAVIAKIEGWS